MTEATEVKEANKKMNTKVRLERCFGGGGRGGLRVFSGPEEDLNLVPSVHILMAHNHMELKFQMPSSGFLYVRGTYRKLEQYLFRKTLTIL